MKYSRQDQFDIIVENNQNGLSKLTTEMNIWEDIAMQINSTEGKEHDYWCDVMDLYTKKYR